MLCKIRAPAATTPPAAGRRCTGHNLSWLFSVRLSRPTGLLWLAPRTALPLHHLLSHFL
jgi:hypothetical protein